MPTPFRVYDTLTRAVQPFVPQVPGEVSLYVCGMTVYDEAHVGHARAMVVFDTLVRHLRARGWRVRFVRNFTDVDDKIIRRAAELGVAPEALAQTYIDRFHRDADGLGLVRPDAEPRVTTSMADILALIERLVAQGHAYASDGSVWFSVASCPDYGKLSNQAPGDLRSEDPEGGKRAAADFALWKAVKPGEPSWPSPWGPGRPGWHIECSAMVAREIGATVDIHGGGLDLVFPHHENEVAQSECAHHQPFARYWMHNGLLTMASGQKMGKSLGNVVNIGAILQTTPAEALRLYYLQNHYRSPLPWDEAALPDALAMLARLYDAREAAERMQGEGDADAVAAQLGPDAEEVLRLGRAFSSAFGAALDDDFNTAAALGFAFELARAINRLANHKKAAARGGPVVAPALAALHELSSSLGLLCWTSAGWREELKAKVLPSLGLSLADVEAQVAERLAARAARDWARADAIRDALEARRIALMDRADGTDWKVRL